MNFSWKDVAHYGAAAGLYVIGVIGASGAHIPGVTIDPVTCFATATGILAAGLKGGWTSGNVVKSLAFIIAIGFAISFGFPAHAATTTKKLTPAQAQVNPLAVLQQLSVTDLQAALADAQANNDATTIPCWTALLAGVQAQQAAAPALPSGVFSAIQKARDLKIQAANLLAPNGPLANLNVACAPLLMDANSTLAAFGIATGVVVGTGGIAIPALPGLLPLLLAPK